MTLDLPYPHKLLWPNGRTRSRMAKAGETKKHRGWAHVATLAKRDAAPAGDGLRLVATFHPKPTGKLPDEDNAAASLKAYQDGIASALGVDDRWFGQPEVRFGARHPIGKVIIEVVAR